MQLETDRLTITTLREGDARHLWPILSDARTMYAWPQPYDYAGVERWVRWALEVEEQIGLSRCLVRRKEDGKVIGDAGLFLLPVHDMPEVVDLGWIFHWPYHNRGYATEAAQAVRDHALGPLGLERLIVHLNWQNHPSRRVAEKIGARYLGRFHNRRYRWMPTDLFEIT